MREAVPILLSLMFAVKAALPLGAQRDGGLTIPGASIPRLPAAGRGAADFAPRGWRVQVQSSGDLNSDGRPDLAFVLHEADPTLVVHSQGFGEENLDTNPRLFGVAFAQPDGSFRLVAQNGTLIPRWTEPNMDDYFGDEGSLQIAHGAVSVGLHYFANMGGWDAGSTTLTFRWQHGRFELIGYDNSNLRRNTGEEVTTSVNFSTGIEVVQTDSMDETSPKKPIIHRRRIRPQPLRTLDQVGNGLELERP